MTTSVAVSFSAWRRVAGLAIVSAVAAFSATAPVAHAAANSVSLDVPYVPTPAEVVNRMLEVAQVGSNDFVIDLGSGDGRIAIAAVKGHGAKGAMGVDLNPQRIAEAQANAKEAGVSDKVEFREQNLFDTDFSQASVLTMYLLPDVNMSLRDKILKLKPGTRVVSHAFDMEDWESDHYEHVDGRSVYLWVVPAQVEGRWKLEAPEGVLELDLTQQFQHVVGTARDEAGNTVPVQGELKGAGLALTIGEGQTAKRYTGNVQGDTMLMGPEGADAAATATQNWKGARL